MRPYDRALSHDTVQYTVQARSALPSPHPTALTVNPSRGDVPLSPHRRLSNNPRALTPPPCAPPPFPCGGRAYSAAAGARRRHTATVGVVTDRVASASGGRPRVASLPTVPSPAGRPFLPAARARGRGAASTEVFPRTPVAKQLPLLSARSRRPVCGHHRWWGSHAPPPLRRWWCGCRPPPPCAHSSGRGRLPGTAATRETLGADGPRGHVWGHAQGADASGRCQSGGSPARPRRLPLSWHASQSLITSPLSWARSPLGLASAIHAQTALGAYHSGHDGFCA